MQKQLPIVWLSRECISWTVPIFQEYRYLEIQQDYVKWAYVNFHLENDVIYIFKHEIRRSANKFSIELVLETI